MQGSLQVRGMMEAVNDAVQTVRRRVGGAFLGPSWSYEAVKQETTSEPHRSVSIWKRVVSHPSSQRVLMLAAIALVLIATTVYATGHGNTTDPVRTEAYRHQDHMLYLVFPSSEPNSEVCKSVVTAAILGYPTPVVINYNATLDEPGRESERARASLNQISHYFNRMKSSSDDNIAVVLDTPYNWFQLRPEVLLDRYYESNRRSNNLLRKLFSADEVAFGRIKQEVVLSLHGQPFSNDNDAFGDDAETSVSPRISSVIGPVGRLRALYRRAALNADQAIGNVDSQMILAEIFDQQELRREGVRQQYRASKARKEWKWRSFFDKSLPDSNIEAEENREGYEFGLGLDYMNEMTLSFEREHDAEFSEHQNPADVTEDIATSMPPFWTPSGSHTLVNKSWRYVSLIMHRGSRTVPVIVSFPHDRNITDFQRTRWMDLWLQDGAQSMLQEAFTVPRLPITSVLDSNNIEHVFWDASVRFDRAGLLTTENGWAPFADICDRDDTWLPGGMKGEETAESPIAIATA